MGAYAQSVEERAHNVRSGFSQTALLGVLLFVVTLTVPLFAVFNLPAGSHTGLVTVLSGLSIMAIIRRGVVSVAGGRFLALTVLFTGVMAVGLMWTDGPSYGLDKVTYFTLRVVVPCVIFANLDLRWSDWTKARLVLLGLCALAAGIGVLSAQTLGMWSRYSAGGNPIWFGRLMGLATLCGVSLAVESLGRGHRSAGRGILGLLGYSFLTLLSAVSIILTGSRAPFWMLLPSLLLFVLLQATVHRAQFRRVFMALCALGFVFWGVQSYATDLAESGIGPAQRVLKVVSEGAADELLGDSRAYLFQTSWDAIKKSPVIGYGLGGSGPILTGTDTRAYPHNLPIEVWLEGGVVALGLFVWIQAKVLYAIMVGIRAKDTRASFLGAMWVYALACSMVSGDLTSNYEVWMVSGAIMATLVTQDSARKALGLSADKR